MEWPVEFFHTGMLEVLIFAFNFCIDRDYWFYVFSPVGKS